MKPSIEVSAMSKSEERQALIQVVSRCFGVTGPSWETFFTRIGSENCRIVRLGGEIVGGLAIYFMGQWFAGKSIPMAGIAAVGVAPELRGTGVASDLMSRTLGELHQAGIPLTTLYASTQRLYRKVGYEQAGVRCQFTIATRSIGIEERSLSLRSVDPAAHEAFHPLYRRRAQEAAGNLDRNRAIWERVVTPRDDDRGMYAYLVEKDGRGEGYVVFTQPEREEGGYNLLIRDLVALTPGAARRLLGLLGDHRSLAREAFWCGPLNDPIACLLPEQDARVRHLERWMMRVVDVPKALMMRGYPEGTPAELHLEVWDDVLPANQGGWILRVADGQAEVKPGGRGDLKLTIGGLAPLYSGFLTPHQLAAIGLLSGPPAALATASRLFAGPEPWMPDFF